jgi:hypothetical protein
VATYIVKLLEVVLFTVYDKSGQGNTGKIAYSNFLWAGVLDNFRTQITALDGTKVLLVRFSVAGILVEHIWGSSFSLRLQNGEPQLLCLDSLATTTFTFIAFIKSLMNK